MTALATVHSQAPIQPKPKRITTAWLARELDKVLTEAFPGDFHE